MRNENITSPNDLLQVKKERVATVKTMANDRLKAYNTAKEDLEKAFAEVQASCGNLKSKLNKVLEDDVKRQAYHSQCFVGNDCKKILDERKMLLDVLPTGDVKSRFTGWFV